MGFFAFLDQLHWYELLGGFIACIVLGVVSFYTLGAILMMFVWGLWTSATFRTISFISVIGGAGWFVFHLIQKYGA